MKKLMIAAAAAAMIGGAYADFAYDFTMNVKTTVGKGGNQSTVKVQLGQDATETFWYEDASVGTYYTIQKDPLYTLITRYNKVDLNGNVIGAINIDDLATTKGVFADVTSLASGNTYEAVISFTSNKYGYIGKLNANFKALSDLEKSDFAYLGDLYDQKSAGKWCDSFTYKAGAQCYRAAGSKKFTDVLYVDDCCDDEYIGDVYTVKFPLNNRFGATTRAKATKIEVCGYVNDFCDAVNTDQFTLAGQGTWKDNLVKIDGVQYAGIQSINGNVVGTLDAPDCETCCQNPIAAIAWACSDPIDDANLPTAAFGTWSLKFNKNK